MNEERGLFEALGESLVAFRAAVEGEAGTSIGAMGADPGVLPDIIRGALEGVNAVLTWLHRISEDIEDWVISGDAAVALFEVGGKTIEAFADGIQLGPLVENDAALGEVLGEINELLQSAAAVIGKAQDLSASILPPVEDILLIHNQLTSLLGERHAGPTDSPGSLTQLMQQIGAS